MTLRLVGKYMVEDNPKYTSAPVSGLVSIICVAMVAIGLLAYIGQESLSRHDSNHTTTQEYP